MTSEKNFVFNAGLVQLCSGRDMAVNLARTSELIREAAGRQADYVLTPEMTNLVEDDKERLAAIIRPEADDISVRGFSALACELGLWLHIGSLALRGQDGRAVNRSLLFSPDGTIVARYDKIHLFDVTLPSGQVVSESRSFTPGDRAVLADLPWGRLGFSICYDMRFPRLFQILARGGAEFLAIPAAFTVPTGRAHWHVLLRARAIETGSFVLAAAQGGIHESGRATYGHTLAVNPWGDIMAEVKNGPAAIIVTVDPAQVVRDRSRIPVLAHAREFILQPIASLATSKP